jgi:hypothetical protein
MPPSKRHRSDPFDRRPLGNIEFGSEGINPNFSGLGNADIERPMLADTDVAKA